MAVDRDHKLKNGAVVPGNAQHDRIQQAGGEESIGEAIRRWYAIEEGRDFERIDVEGFIREDPRTKKSHFILIPTAIKMRGAKSKKIEKIAWPLSFHQHYQSKLWKDELARRRKHSPDDVEWAGHQIWRIVSDRSVGGGHVHEADLLRATGALSLLGLEISPYLSKGYDCPESAFQFGKLPKYPCPVELKNRSQKFSWQVTTYKELPRAVVLCMKHDYVNLPDDIDVIELPTLAEYLASA